MSTEEKVINEQENQEVTAEQAQQSSAQETVNENEVTDNVTEDSEAEGDNKSEVADSGAIWQDKYMRLSAEFDNYRKRTLKEKMELIESAGEDVIKAVLSIVDDFDRAAAASAKSDDAESIKNGMALIHKRLLEVLQQKGVTEIEAVGADLDTDYHDAIAKFPADEDKKGKVIDVVEKGYKLKDKVIRFSKVVVGE